jgi:cytochrome P450 family 135
MSAEKGGGLRDGEASGESRESQERVATQSPAGSGEAPSAGANGALPPGPKLHPAVMQFRLMRPENWLESCWKEYGDYFTLRPTKDRALVLTADTAAVKQVFTGNPKQLFAGESHMVLARILGPRSVLTINAPDHLRVRRMMLPPFHGDRMKGYAPLIAQVAERHIASWPRGEEFPVLPRLNALTLEVIMRAVFGVEDPKRIAELSPPLLKLLAQIGEPRRMLALQVTFERKVPFNPWKRFYEIRREADEMLFREIRARRSDPAGAEGEDIFSMLLAARDEQGEPLTDEELRDELMTLLVAGHDTTSTAMGWTLERLTRHPQVLERLRSGELTEEDPYLDAVIKETLRLRPVVPIVARRLTAPMEFGGWQLPAGTFVGPSIFLVHRREDIYPEPHEYRPERFLDHNPGTYEWIPFGGGTRRCLGAPFALMEIKTVLGTMLKNVQLRRSQAKGEAMARHAITFDPARGARVTIDAS